MTVAPGMEKTPDLSSSRSLVGEYQLERLLGEGGMGRVYLARHTILDRPVVVKRILPHLATNPELVRRFVVEAQAAARLQHRHVVEIYDAATDAEGVPYIVLAYLKGQSLREWMERRRATQGPFVPLGLVVILISQIASALKAAHERAIVHRDIKPDNVFLTLAPIETLALLQRAGLPTDLDVRVLDFGIAKLTDVEPVGPHGTGTQSAVGTPAYMAAEQLKSARHADARADQYSLAAMVFELVTGQVPWGDTPFAELYARQMHESVPDPRKLNPALPRGVASVIRRGLKREPADRWPTIEAFARALAAEVPPGDGLPGGTELLRAYALELTGIAATVPPLVVGPSTDVQPPGFTAQGSNPAASHAAVPARRRRRALVMALAASAIAAVAVGAVIATGGGTSPSRVDAVAPSTDADAALGTLAAPPLDGGISADAPAPAPPTDAAPPLDAAPPIDAGRRIRHHAGSGAGTGAGTGSSSGIRDVLHP